MKEVYFAFRVKPRVPKEAWIELLRVGPDDCDVLVHAGRKYRRINLAHPRDGISGNVEKNVAIENFDVLQARQRASRR